MALAQIVCHAVPDLKCGFSVSLFISGRNVVERGRACPRSFDQDSRVTGISVWKMVGSRWESSKRPLFVRTVWKDGHHHVVFEKEEEISGQTARSARRNPSSSRSSKKFSPPTPEPSINFKVPSVKLLLAGLRNFKSDPRTKRCRPETTRDHVKSAITVDIIPSDSIRFNNLNKQVFFKNERHAFKLTPKANSIEVNHFYQEDRSVDAPQPFSYNSYCLDQFNTTLSERVMIWLDLAIQNDKQFKNVDLKKRVATAQVTRNMKVNENNNNNINNNNNNRKEIEEKLKSEVATTPLVTSRIECQRLEEEIIEEKKVAVRTGTAKRQLHIFLPNLPKKSSDSGSFLSSKISSKM